MIDVGRIESGVRTQNGPRHVDRVTAALAARQHGVVARRQMLAAGIGAASIARRLQDGRLLRLHRGVFAFGHAHLAIEGRWLAAVLAVGPGAALSHACAAAHRGLRTIPSGPIHVSTARRGRGSLTGLVNRGGGPALRARG